MSKFKKEYSILPQCEGDDYQQHIVRTNEPSRSCFLIPLITVTIILILSGVVTLTLSLFFPESFSQVVHWSHVPLDRFTSHSDIVEGIASSTTIATNDKKSTTNVSPVHKPHGSVAVDDIESENSISADSSSEHFANSSSTEYYDSKEETGNSTATGQTHHGSHEKGESDGDEDGISSSTSKQHPGTDKPPKNESFITTEEYIQMTRKFVQSLEYYMGISQPELVIPLFMLICFMTSLTIVSLCCCCIMKRKDNRRRKLFGKIITDLQTGDSKTVLLNHDMDD